MTNAVLKANIERLLKEKNWKISELEKKLGSGSTRHINNIFRGSSKNPTIEVLQSIAKAFNIGVQDLVAPSTSEDLKVDTKLLLESCTIIIKEMELFPESSNLTCNNIFSLIKELYEGCLRLKLSKVDSTLAKWLVQNYKK